MKVTAIIVAAGSSTRMGKAVSKQLIKLNGSETILHTMRAFDNALSISETVVVCRENDISEIQSLALKNGINKITAFVCGGDTRQQSVANGINAVSVDTDYVAIHDGARPLVLPDDIDLTVENAVKYGSSALGVFVKDTIKVVDKNGFIESTPDRSRLVAIATPQIFELSLYKKAMLKAVAEKKDYTDDCQLIESLDEKVFVTLGNPSNIKLTTPEDIITAEAFLRSRE